MLCTAAFLALLPGVASFSAVIRPRLPARANNVPAALPLLRCNIQFLTRLGAGADDTVGAAISDEERYWEAEATTAAIAAEKKATVTATTGDSGEKKAFDVKIDKSGAGFNQFDPVSSLGV